MSAPSSKISEAFGQLQPSCRKTAAHALTVVRDGVITGEGPTTKGRIHFSRALDADDAAWCARILTATAVEHQPVSRAEAEALFEISDAAAEYAGCAAFASVGEAVGVCAGDLQIEQLGIAAVALGAQLIGSGLALSDRNDSASFRFADRELLLCLI